MITRAIGLAEVCSEPWGRSTLMAFGDTMVEVIIKNISSRKIRSVMDDMLKLGDIFCLLFNAIRVYFSVGSFNKSMKASVRASI